jgi:glycogen debranching enzyme
MRNKRSALRRNFGRLAAQTALASICLMGPAVAQTLGPADRLEIARPVRPWQPADAVGPQAAWFGNEAGNLEAWVYPLKILHNFHLVFHAEGHTMEAAPLARTIIARPESTTIVYASDTFSVRETLLAPIDKAGVLILLDIHSSAPMEVETRFERDFQLEWPAVLADPEINWIPRLNGFAFACERPGYTAIIGSPTAALTESEYATNYASSRLNGFRLGLSERGESHRVIAVAASVHSAVEAEATYREMIAQADSTAAKTTAALNDNLRTTVSLKMPDSELQQAYDWARVSLVQSMVRNPQLPEGMIAGYRFAADDRRPGFNWFFGRDALWTAFAWNAEGDFRSTRAALDFLGHYQRADGKIPHEIPQSAALIAPLNTNLFSYASADATPLYLIALDDYLTRSGDLEFVRRQRAVMERTLSYLRSTFDEHHMAKDEGSGHGWVEGGPLYPVRMELYQAGLGVEATRCAARLEQALGNTQQGEELRKEAAQASEQLEPVFWMESAQHYAFALDLQGKQVDAPSVEATVPIWFDLLPAAHARKMLDELALGAHQTDWGMRIVSSADARYDPGGYHNGSVWPLFTGWAAVAEYRNHRDFEAYENLRANALLTFAGTPGRVTEVLSGDAMQELATTTSHQTWSSAMVIEPLLLGMFGLRVDAQARTITLAPHLPADWPFATIGNIRLADASVDVRFEQSKNRWHAVIDPNHARGAVLELSPAFSPHARIVRVTEGGHKIAYKVEPTADDQQVRLRLTLSGEQQAVEIRTEGDIRLAYDATLPQLGESSQGVRLVGEQWNTDHSLWTLEFEGRPGAAYDMRLVGADSVGRVEGGAFEPSTGALHVSIPASGPPHATLRIALRERK